ncbi:MAG: NAD(P)H-hydrate epimerase, partial [bacterium]
MRIATARQMAAIDRETIDSGIPGEELMENAGREMVRRSLDLFGELAPPARVAICCGKGNNGGDGLVMARLFNGLGFEVSVMLLALPEDLSADARLNHDRLPSTVQLAAYPASEWAFRWSELAAGADLAVDAVFGTGIQPPVRGDYVGLFQAFNELPTPVLSVDIPSGVCGDTG